MGLLNTLKKILASAGKPTEQSSDRNGFLSYAAETHALGIGVYHGMKSPIPKPPKEVPDNEDVKAEPHYYKGGFVLGTFLQAFLIVALGGQML